MGLLSHKISYKIYYYLFFALAVAIPIHGKLVPPIIFLIGLNWILEFNFGEKLRRITSIKRSKYLMGFALYYLLYMIGVLYSERANSQNGALFILEVKLSLLLFPIFFSTIDFKKLHPYIFVKVQRAFIIGCLISMILLFNNAVFSYFQSNSSDVFYYVKLGFVHHPSYIAMYFAFAISILLNWVLQNWKLQVSKRNAALILIIVLQLFIVLLSSKAGIISVVLIYLTTILFLLSMKKWRNLIPLPVVLIVLFLVTLMMFPASYERFYSAETAMETEPDNNTQDGSAARVLVWKASLDLIKKYPIFGVGTGDVEPELMKIYEENNIQLAMDESLNAHNQYLQTFIALGVIGFLFLLASLALPAIFAFRKKHLLYLLFLLMFGFNLLVESMMERQGGVVFYAFFNCFLFYFAYLSEETSEPEFP